jgi:integrase
MVTTSKELTIVNISQSSEVIDKAFPLRAGSAFKSYNTHRDDHRPVSFLLESEVNDLVDAAGTMRDGPRNSLLLLLLFQCCLRISECLQLTKNHRIFVKGKPILKILGKGNKPRLVPMPEKLSDKFGNYLSLGDGLSPNDKLFPITRFRALQIVKQCGKKAGLDNRRIYNHLFRHAGAIARLKKTGNIESLKQYLGHTDRKMTERYLVTLQTIESLEIEGNVAFDK